MIKIQMTPKTIKQKLQELEGQPITEHTRDYLLNMYSDFMNELESRNIKRYIEARMDYSSTEWVIHDKLTEVIKLFSNALNQFNNVFWDELVSAKEFSASRKLTDLISICEGEE